MTKDEQIETLEANNADLEHDIRNAENRMEELEDLLSEAISDKEHFEQQASYLEDALDEVSSLERDCSVLEDKIEELEEQLDECESPTFGMSISQVSCYEVFMDILERLPKPAHEIEEELIKMFLNGK